MKQILQDLKNGETLLVDIPEPSFGARELYLASCHSLVSVGTERMLIEFGKANWIDKARKQPDKVRQVLTKVKTDGFVATLNAVQAKLDQAIPLGYANVGRVVDLGKQVSGFRVGDLVVSNGPHAEFVSVPEKLCAKVPSGVKPEHASFTVLGSIGLQGVRLLQPTLGEHVVVIGLGLIGLLTVQILRANGCRVIGIDFDAGKCAMAERFGATSCVLSDGVDPVSFVHDLTNGVGCDGVLITASTSSSDPVRQAANMSRKRGRIVLVGVTGLELSRADFYEKELSFQVSCSYGPGRYDSGYELQGRDYPIGFVRWTEQRNFEAILELMRDGTLDVEPLVSSRYPFSEGLTAYKDLSSPSTLGIVLNYEAGSDREETEVPDSGRRTVELSGTANSKSSPVAIGLIGAGNFAAQVLLPALEAAGPRLKRIVSAKGVSGTHLGKKFGFERSSTEIDSVFSDDDVNAVVVCTRHNSHGRLVVRALEAGKKVFVEKPLCISLSELDEVVATYERLQADGKRPFVMVGFNRRFAPQIVKLKSLLKSVPGPRVVNMTVNAGAIPTDHWTQDPNIGGGRIVGEGCHFIDLIRFIADSSIVAVRRSICRGEDKNAPEDTVTIQLEFTNGSIGTLHYLSNGNKQAPKERLEVFSGGKVATIDNFQRMVGYGFKGFKKLNLWKQDKGHGAEILGFTKAAEAGNHSPIPFDEIVEVTKASFRAAGLLSE